MSDATAYKLQRLSAMFLAPLVLVHLAVILYAIEGGLTGTEILARTRASLIWPLFYVLFVVAVTIHAPLGLRAILREWTGWSRTTINAIASAFAATILVLGLRAVWAVS